MVVTHHNLEIKASEFRPSGNSEQCCLCRQVAEGVNQLIVQNDDIPIKVYDMFS
jgi:hypothetical protein